MYLLQLHTYNKVHTSIQKKKKIAKPEVRKQGLLSSLRYFGKVYQIRRVLRNGYFEGRMTITLDPSVGHIDDNGNLHDPHPLQRMLYLESWDVFAPASYKGAAPICYYCRQAGHIRSTCPDLAKRKCFGCGRTGHTRRFCSTKPTAPATNTISEPSETQLLDQYLQQSTSAHDENEENADSNNVTTVENDTVEENVDIDDQPMEHASTTTPEMHEQQDLLDDEHMDMEDEVIAEQTTQRDPSTTLLASKHAPIEVATMMKVDSPVDMMNLSRVKASTKTKSHSVKRRLLKSNSIHSATVTTQNTSASPTIKAVFPPIHNSQSSARRAQ